MAASPAGLHCLDVTHKALGQTDTNDLEEGDGHKDRSPRNQAVLQPLVKLARAAAFSAHGALLLQLQFELHDLATPGVGDTFRRVPEAAGEGHPAALPAGVQVSVVEINTEVPVFRPSGSAARRIFLSKVNELLEVNVVPKGLDVVVEEEIERVSNPVHEYEGRDPCCQLQEADETEEG